MSNSERAVIGITGEKNAGKDTFARKLIGDYGFTRVALADPVKEAALILDPVLFLDFYRPVALSILVARAGWDEAKSYPAVRGFLQRLGTDFVRKFDSEFWVRIAANTIADIDGPVVVTDVRFNNEASWVQAQDYGYVVKILRSQESDDDHISEAGILDLLVDSTIINDGTVEQLWAKADELMDQLGYAAKPDTVQ